MSAGAYTGYWHQSELDVSAGTVVQVGELIGERLPRVAVTVPIAPISPTNRALALFRRYAQEEGSGTP